MINKHLLSLYLKDENLAILSSKGGFTFFSHHFATLKDSARTMTTSWMMTNFAAFIISLVTRKLGPSIFWECPGVGDQA